MKVIAAIEADFERGPLGTRSRLRDDLLGETVLRRTLRRVLACSRLASVHLVVDLRQEALACAAVEGLAVRVETHSAGPSPWQTHVASGRKWSLDSWRGGLGGTTVFDESIHPWVLEALARREQAEAVATIPAAAAVFDPSLLAAMIAHYEQVCAEVRMTFTQSPPGLSAAIYAPAMLADLAKTVQPPGRTLAYRPTEPSRDAIMQACYFTPPPAIARATGRLIADTDEAIARVRTLLVDADSPDGADASAAERVAAAERLGTSLRQFSFAPRGLPGEVEIELTTDDSLPSTTLRPRGQVVGRRGPLDPRVFGRLIDELAQRDDVRVVLGGYGDPLLHPEFGSLLRKCREAGIFGLAVRTPAITLDEAMVETLIEHRVDVLNVLLDAATPGTYSQVHGADYFEQVTANVDRVLAAHACTKQPLPLVVCEMVKTRATIGEMEAFYDRWVSKSAGAVIVGPSAHAGQWQDLGVMKMSPPARFACGRIFNRAMVLADGRVTVCDQDFRGEHALGSITDGTLHDLWIGAAMQAVREAELAGLHDGMPMCPACEEWHRP